MQSRVQELVQERQAQNKWTSPSPVKESLETEFSESQDQALDGPRLTQLQTAVPSKVKKEKTVTTE